MSFKPSKLFGISILPETQCYARYLLAQLMVFDQHAPHLYSAATDSTVQPEREIELVIGLLSEHMFHPEILYVKGFTSFSLTQALVRNLCCRAMAIRRFRLAQEKDGKIS
jgi:hypothetical protein